MSAATDRKTPAETSGNLLRQILYGRLVSSDFFARNWMAMLLIMFVALVYIGGKYTCQTKMEEIQRLEKEYEIVKAERVRVRSEYMSQIRESSMQTMVDTLHLNLSVQEQPPYRMPAEE